jgi:hypothetical protein
MPAAEAGDGETFSAVLEGCLQGEARQALWQEHRELFRNMLEDGGFLSDEQSEAKEAKAEAEPAASPDA